MNLTIASYIVTFVLFQEIIIVLSSPECNANIFYDFMYCSSANAQCAQCIPCYNNNELYTPIGEEYAIQCNEIDNICIECKAHCQDNFNHQNYDAYIKNTDASCPSLTNFISEMDADTLPFSTLNNSTVSYQYDCENEDTISITYAILSSSDGYVHSDKNECTLDFSNELITQCNGRTQCTFNINPLFTKLNCVRSNNFIAEIGAFCMSTHSEEYNGHQFDTVDDMKNEMNNLDIIYITIIAVLGGYVILTITIIICQRKGWYKRCDKCNKCKKPVSDSQRTLNNNKKKRTQRAQSDTMEKDEDMNDETMKINNTTNTIMNNNGHNEPKPHHQHHHHGIPSNNNSQPIAYNNNYQAQQARNNKRIHTNTNDEYQNMMHRQQLPRRNNNTSHQDKDTSNNNTQPDAMVVTFQPPHVDGINGIGNSVNVNNRPSVSYANSNNNNNNNNNSNTHYSNVVTTNDATHNRNTSVIVNGLITTQTRSTAYGSFSGATPPQQMTSMNPNGYMSSSAQTHTGHTHTHIAQASNTTYDAYGHSLKSHPVSMLNQSDVIFPFQPTGQSDELVHQLMANNNINNPTNSTAQFHTDPLTNEQKINSEYTNYWNQYYGINQSPIQAQPLQQYYAQQNINNNVSNYPDFANPNGISGADYPDFANPNGDYYDDSKIEIISHLEIQLEAEIGKGTNSKVFKARWRNTEVAAKRFTNLDISSKKTNEYIDKYAIRVNKEPNDNVIKILAIANKPFTLLTEYMNKGSVKNYVRRSRPGSTSISILDRIEIALQAAKGIQHLHKLGIVHSEITCRNLLMELKYSKYDQNSIYKKLGGNRYNISDIRVVITDYAIQQMLSGDELETYRSSLGPLKWMAPELIENSNIKTTFESDIYAFGITMWEIITGQEPYPDVDPVDTAIHVLVKERRPQSYAFIPEKIQLLMKLCWHKHIKQRPNAKEIVKKLTQFVQIERKQNNDRDDLFE